MIRLMLTLFAGSVLFLGCGGAEPAAPESAPAEPAAEPAAAEPAAAGDAAAAPAAKADLPGDPKAGEKIYKANCMACHQADGTGMGGALAADFIKDTARLAKSNDELLKSIAEGVPGTTMIAWGAILDEQKRKDVLSYIRVTYGAK